LIPGSEIHPAAELWSALGEKWPSDVGYALSFLVIGVMWINHHALFEYIKQVNRTLLVANLLLLMGVGFVPFPTAVLAEHLADPLTRSAATAFYGATLVFMSLTLNLVWTIERRERLLSGTAFLKDLDERGHKKLEHAERLQPTHCDKDQ
jgi:uncharacterized membrane protein